MFDLENAIRLWARQLRHRRAFSADDVEELERHLRDDVARRMRQGASEREAFAEAMRDLGDWATMEDEYGKTYWEKQRRHGRRHLIETYAAMFKNYVKIALRNTARHPGYTAINVVGLAAGIAVGLLILLYAWNVLTFDRFHAHADDTYFVYRTRPTDSGPMRVNDTWYPVLDELKNEYAQIEDGVRFLSTSLWVQAGDQRHREAVDFADPAVLSVFDFPLAHGDRDRALDQPGSIVLSEAMARKYFGDAEAAMEQALTLNFTDAYTVTGVFAPIPANSTFQFDLVAPLQGLDFVHETGWNASYLFTFARLRPGTDPDELEALFPAFTEKFFVPAEKGDLKLLPLSEYNETQTNQRRYANILLLIALGILAIACINFVNLATARSMLRAREIGMRKVLGATRGTLVGQFMGEAAITVLAAMAGGVLLARLVLPAFNEFVGMEMGLGVDARVVLGLIGLGVVITLLAGFYPALYLSRFQAAAILKQNARTSPRRAWLRDGLVVVQFALAFLLLVGIGGMAQQVAYMKSQDVKFDQENVLVLNASPRDFADREAAVSRIQALKQKLEGIAGVQAVSASGSVPGRYNRSFTLIHADDRRDGTPFDWRFTDVDADYFDLYDIPFVEGRPFSADLATDAEAVILNEAAVRAIGWDSALGRKMVTPGGREFEIIGVVADFNYLSLENTVEPVLHFYEGPESAAYQFLSVKLTQNSVGTTLPLIRQAWQQFDPTREAEYTFIDEAFNAQYETEENVLRLVAYAAGLALAIACLGLFGLAAFMVVRRTKEVGVRKVMGASVPGLVALLARDFARLVLIAVVVASPPAWWALSGWLENFAYRTTLSPWLFVGAAVLALAVALLTVSYQTLRAATTDPVQALRYE